MKDLAIKTDVTALDVFQVEGGLDPQVEGGLDPIIEQVEVLVRGFDHDLSTAEGRKRTASLSHKVSRTKIYLDTLRMGLVRDWKTKAEGKRMRDALDALRDEARRPLTEWEDADKERTDRLEAEIHQIELHSQTGRSLSDMDASEQALDAIVIGDKYQEFELHAKDVLARTKSKLANLIAIERHRIAREKEIEKLKQRNIQLENEKRVAAYQKRKAKEEQRKAEREAAEREAAAQQAIEDEKRKPAEREAAAEKAIEDEKRKAADLKAADLEAAIEKHIEDQCYQESLDALEMVIDSEHIAGQVLQAIQAGEIPHVNFDQEEAQC